MTPGTRPDMSRGQITERHMSRLTQPWRIRLCAAARLHARFAHRLRGPPPAAPTCADVCPGQDVLTSAQILTGPHGVRNHACWYGRPLPPPTRLPRNHRIWALTRHLAMGRTRVPARWSCKVIPSSPPATACLRIAKGRSSSLILPPDSTRIGRTSQHSSMSTRPKAA
jgi:hypothetical protein